MKDRWKRTWPWVAGGIVAIAVILTVVGLLWPAPGGDPEPNADPSQTGTAPTSSTEPSADDGRCDMPENDSAEVPSDVRWEAAAGVTWPVSDSLGPASEENGMPTCFAHSPVGAALAATSIMYAQAGNDPSTVLDFYLVDSPGRDEALASAGGVTSFAENLQSSGLSIAGFSVPEYTSDRATVELVFAAPNTATGYGAISVTVVWVDGDWRLRPLDDGTVAGPGTAPRLGGFTAWSP